MSIDIQNITNTEDPPLTRADVERLLREVGSPHKLNLSGRNLNGIDLSEFNLVGANLSGANLGGANLREATLNQANLSRADLRQADLVKSNLHDADLHGANLHGAELGLADLSKADLSDAYLPTASLSRANLRGAILRNATLNFVGLGYADLSEANLSGAILDNARLHYTDLSGADLRGANLNNVDLREAKLTGVHISQVERQQLLERGITTLGELNTQSIEESSIFHIRIVEEPLTAQNLTVIISNLTELSTKFWLIVKERFTNLIEYTQTHNRRFAEEANMIITRVAYNSPLNIDLKVDMSVSSVADALVKVIDGITGIRKKLEIADLEIQAKEQEINQSEQKADQDQEMALLEREKQRLEIERLRLEVLEKRLETQKKAIEFALEIANKVIDALHPDADPATRAMEVQALLPNLVQLQNGRGLEIVLPAPQNEKISSPKEV